MTLAGPIVLGRSSARFLTGRVCRVACLIGFALLFAGASFAQESQPASQPTTKPASRPTSRPASRPAKGAPGKPTTGPSTSTTTKATSTTSTSAATTTSTTTSRPAEKKDRFLAVINGNVHTVTGPVLERATVLSKNGALVALGINVQLPPECEVIDAQGMSVYPGLVATMSGGLLSADDPEDSTNVYGLAMTVALAGGITTVATGNSAGKLTFGTTEDMLLKGNLWVRLAYTTHKPLERAQLRTDFEKVRNYLRDVRKYEREKATNKDAKPPNKDWLTGKYEEYRRLLQREAVAFASAQTAQELLDVTELASTYGFDLVIRGAYEGWTVASQLGRTGSGAILTPREHVDPDERFNRPTGSTIENARILREHGVTVAVVSPTPGILFSGLAGRELLHLNMEAAFAVRGGLSNDDAVRTITIDAARLLRLDDRIGSLEVGKDADLIVCDGDLLHYMTQVHYTIVNGRVAYDKSKSTLYAHIRPQGKPEVPVFDDLWPRRLEWRE